MRRKMYLVNDWNQIPQRTRESISDSLEGKLKGIFNEGFYIIIQTDSFGNYHAWQSQKFRTKIISVKELVDYMMNGERDFYFSNQTKCEYKLINKTNFKLKGDKIMDKTKLKGMRAVVELRSGTLLVKQKDTESLLGINTSGNRSNDYFLYDFEHDLTRRGTQAQKRSGDIVKVTDLDTLEVYELNSTIVTLLINGKEVELSSETLENIKKVVEK